MGKDSLIKSTSKQKTASRKDAAAEKSRKVQPTRSKTAARVTKKAPQTTAAAKGKTAPKAKQATQSNSTPKAIKTATAPLKKHVTRSELLARKFDLGQPAKLDKVRIDSKRAAVPSAPPIVGATDPAEAARLKSLLLKKYDYQMLVAAAEKAAAVKAADKAAADRATADKAAADKAAAVKTAAAEKAADPAQKMMKYGIAGFVLLVLLVIGASYLNTGNFYIKTADGATEIWQGKFAPKGAKLLISLPGMVYSEPLQDAYSKDDAFPLIFNYYIQKADTLLDVPGLPDFEGVKSYLHQALAYGTTAKLKESAYRRLNTIDLMVLLYKADVAASKDSVADLENALTYLKEAIKLDMDPLQKEHILQKITAASARLEALRAQAAPAEEAEAAAPEAAGETATAH